MERRPEVEVADPKLQFDVYEVFAQTDPMGHHVHEFSLLASGEDMALALAQQNFLRRAEIVSIWVVRRDQIGKSRPEQREQFGRLDKPYRMKQSYGGLVEKWRRYKEHPLPRVTTETPGPKSGDESVHER